MAFTQTQLDAIETAIATGELRVSFEGKTIEYRSMTDLMAARDLIRASLSKRQRQTRVYSPGKGV